MLTKQKLMSCRESNIIVQEYNLTQKKIILLEQRFTLSQMRQCIVINFDFGIKKEIDIV